MTVGATRRVTVSEALTFPVADAIHATADMDSVLVLWQLLPVIIPFVF